MWHCCRQLPTQSSPKGSGNKLSWYQRFELHANVIWYEVWVVVINREMLLFRLQSCSTSIWSKCIPLHAGSIKSTHYHCLSHSLSSYQSIDQYGISYQRIDQHWQPLLLWADITVYGRRSGHTNHYNVPYSPFYQRFAKRCATTFLYTYVCATTLCVQMLWTGFSR
jgi:hypothetical protein